MRSVNENLSPNASASTIWAQAQRPPIWPSSRTESRRFEALASRAASCGVRAESVATNAAEST